MTERWIYERTGDGWEIRDENRLLVAYLPDARHEREDEAKLIADAPRLGAELTKIKHGRPARRGGGGPERPDPGESTC